MPGERNEVRINYSEDEDFGGQFELWQANCRRSIKGAKGQQALRELRDALLALPTKRLISGALESNGEFCAIGAYAKAKGLTLAQFGEDEHERAGEEAGMPRLVSWKVVYENDEGCGWLPRSVVEPPEARYERMLRWVERCLAK